MFSNNYIRSHCLFYNRIWQPTTLVIYPYYIFIIKNSNQARSLSLTKPSFFCSQNPNKKKTQSKVSHTVQDLVFIWNMTDPLVVNPEIELPQLDISNNYTTDCTIEYSTGNFTCLAVVFNLRRRLGYHLFHTYIPSALIVVMSWISFWIKPEAIPARVTLGVTSLLTLATQNTQSQQSLPPVSYVKAIDVWMSSCSVFVFLSLMEFAVVNNYMGPVATKVMKGFSDEDLSEAIDFNNKNGYNKTHRSSDIPQYDTFCHGRETALCIDKFSRFFFPFSFFILNVTYWTTFL
uniref:Glycine receptor subunit alpha-2 n=2 Tax=Culex pipiens TaxID=7175 RepID=A0A8D8D1Y6_CULPI